VPYQHTERQLELGRAAYTGYGLEADHQTFDGREMLDWSELSERIQDAWAEAAERVRDRVLGGGVKP
jgi:hypothetical protein